MAASSLPLIVFSAFFAVLAVSAPSSLPPPPTVYHVGGERGWTVPSQTSNGTETFDQWSQRNRFHAGDVLDFKYPNGDSVLLVRRGCYERCRTASPMRRFAGGATRFTLDRPGLFYFISGKPGHCEAGQRMPVRVAARSAAALATAPAPAIPAPGAPPASSGPPTVVFKLTPSATAWVATVCVFVFVLLCLLALCNYQHDRLARTYIQAAGLRLNTLANV